MAGLYRCSVYNVADFELFPDADRNYSCSESLLNLWAEYKCRSLFINKNVPSTSESLHQINIQIKKLT